MSDTIDLAIALRVAAEAVLVDLECPHNANEYGNCHDCMNTGYAICCQQEQDLVEGCNLILKATAELVTPRYKGNTMTDPFSNHVIMGDGTYARLAPMSSINIVTEADGHRSCQHTDAIVCDIAGHETIELYEVVPISSDEFRAHPDDIETT